jgi:hypothetical protein
MKRMIHLIRKYFEECFLDSFINRHFWLSYARIRVIFTASSKADDIVRLTRITAESEDANKVKNLFMK